MAEFIPRKLTQLFDVLISGVSDGQVLAWNAAASKWENATSSGGGGGVDQNATLTADRTWTTGIHSLTIAGDGELYFGSSNAVILAGGTSGGTTFVDYSGSSTVQFLNTGAISFVGPSSITVDAATPVTISGTLTATLTGNASSATKLATARAINGVNFDGTAAITVTAAASTLTGSTLASGITASSLTSVGTLTGGATGAGFTIALGSSTITGTLPDANLAADVFVMGNTITTSSADKTTSLTASGGHVNILNAGSGGQLRISSGGVLDFETGALITQIGSNIPANSILATGLAGVLTPFTVLPAGYFPALTGDVTTVAGALASTLATVNSNTGSWGSATQVAQITLNGKGLATAAANVTITPAESSITFTDITTNNVSTTKHGFAPKAPNDSTKFLDGTGAYSVPAGTGTVTTVGFTGGLISVANPTTTPAFTVAGTSGGIPYFSSASTWGSSSALASGAILSGGGAGNAPVANTTAGGILTFIGSPTSANLAAVLTDETGSGAAVFGTSPTIVTPAITGLATGTTTSIGVAQTNGLLLTNTTAAANGSQQYSPAIELDGNGWSTGASASQAVKWGIQNQTAQGSSASGTLKFLSSIAGGGFNSQFNVTSGGAVSWVGTCTSGTDITVSSGGINISTGGNFHVTGRSQWQSSADGLMDLYNNGFGNFTRLNFGGVSNSFNGIGRDAVNGFIFQSAAGTSTYNDASTGNSGTVANRYLVGIAAPTLTATGTSVTDTVASTVYIGGAPTASTNTTIGTAWALNVAAGNTNLGGAMTLGGGTSVKNIRHGITGALTAGSVTVTDTGATANTRYFFTPHTLGTVTIPTDVYASSRSAGASFVLSSANVTDTSVYDWIGFEP